MFVGECVKELQWHIKTLFIKKSIALSVFTLLCFGTLDYTVLVILKVIFGIRKIGLLKDVDEIFLFWNN